MLRSRFLLLIGAVGLLLSSVSCGGGPVSNPPPPPGGGQAAPVSVAIGDAPPAGVTILSFEVTVTQVALQPGSVQLVSTPIEIEVRRLELEAAFLSTFNVSAGTYTSMDVTFMNPQVTFRNDGATNLGIPCTRGSSNAGGVCEIEINVTRTVSITSNPPFPLTITANSAAGLLIDVNLSNLVQTNLSVDFNAAQAITVVRLQAAQGTGQFEELEDVQGRISALRAAASEFDMQTAGGRTLTVRTNNGTEFEDFDTLGCAASPQNFSCLAVGQVVEADLRLMPGGMLIARKVEATDNDNEPELQGIVVNVPGAASTFEMVLIHESLNVPGVAIGNRVAVNLLPGTRFRVDRDGLSLPVGAIFLSSSDLILGQVVEVERRTPPSGTPPAFDSDEIKLKDTRLRGTVQSVDTVNNRVVLSNLPGILGVTQLDVFVDPSETEFHNVPGNALSGLAPNDTVSVRGLLFKGAGTPFLVAKRIRRR